MEVIKITGIINAIKEIISLRDDFLSIISVTITSRGVAKCKTLNLLVPTMNREVIKMIIR
ncbi:hypothetical protein CAPN002_11390 [Capnocytophaga stomatis]|nr:hypothetical protein CAPN002_11390 [Capnocytophaga stomatis]